MLLSCSCAFSPRKCLIRLNRCTKFISLTPFMMIILTNFYQFIIKETHLFFSLTKVIYHSIIRDMKVVEHSCQGVTFVKYICILFRLLNIDINLLIQENRCAFQYVLFLNAIKIRINLKYPFSLMELGVKLFFSEILY